MSFYVIDKTPLVVDGLVNGKSILYIHNLHIIKINITADSAILGLGYLYTVYTYTVVETT